MRELMCESAEEVGAKFGGKCAAALANDLVAAITRVEAVRHADIEADDLHHIVTEAAGGQGSRVTKKKLKTGTFAPPSR